MPERDPFSLVAKVVVQCGGSGLLGRALTSALLESGATVVVASRKAKQMAPVMEQSAPSDARRFAEDVDIESETSVHALRDRVLRHHGRVDGLVFNAVNRPMRGFSDNLSAWEASMKTNATGMFATVRAFGDAMAKQGSGSIVNIASHMGMVGMHPPLYDSPAAFPSPDYFFHKGGMVNLTRYLASHYGASGVRVNVVSPGGIYNPERPQPAGFLEKYAAMTILGRMAQASEIGGAVTFMLSDASSYITGVNLPVDGGYTAK